MGATPPKGIWDENASVAEDVLLSPGHSIAHLLGVLPLLTRLSPEAEGDFLVPSLWWGPWRSEDVVGGKDSLVD